MRLWQLLNEDWENLAQLNLGPMMDMLKQDFSTYGTIGKKINPTFVWKGITSTSEIIDLGVIKGGLKDIRTAFRKHSNPEAGAFSVYIGGQPVMVAITDQHNLAGATREARMAWDLSSYKTVIDEIEQEVQPWNKFNKKIKTEEEREIYGYFDGEYKEQLVRTVGIDTTTDTVSYIMAMIMSISKHINQPVTAKVVLRDHLARDKRQARSLTRTQIAQGTKELKERLLAYKISKQPTANTIHDFIKWCEKNHANVVSFAGVAYRMKPTEFYGNGPKLTPLQVMEGKPFDITYESVSNSGYSSDRMIITYRYVAKETGGGMVPVYARWNNKEGNRTFNQEAALDSQWYFNNRMNFGSSQEEKDRRIQLLRAISAIIKDPTLASDDIATKPLIVHALTLIKDKKYNEALVFIEALQNLNINFDELNAVYNITKSKRDEQYGIRS